MPKTLTAKHKVPCPACDKTIQKQTKIVLDTERREWVHPACWKARHPDSDWTDKWVPGARFTKSEN